MTLPFFTAFFSRKLNKLNKPPFGLVFAPLLLLRMAGLIFQGAVGTKINRNTSFVFCFFFFYHDSYYCEERRVRVSILLAEIRKYSFHCQRCLVMSF